MFKNLKISVVVPVKNGEKQILNCLHALFQQTLAPYEIIIVDGNSTDKTVEIIKKHPVRLIVENHGSIGGARQVGVEHANGDLIAFTDADCIPQKEWLENLVKGFDGGIVGVGGGVQNIGKGLWEESIGLALNTFLGGAYSVQDRVYNSKRYVKSISGCNCIYRKTDLIKIGGYNKSLSINEDTEINQRLLKIGKLIYVPDAIVLHDQNRNLKQFIKRMYDFGYGRGKNKLIDIQIIPPIVALFVVGMLLIYWKFSLIMLLIYFTLILLFDIKIFISDKKVSTIFTVPIIFLLEHISYSIGFYKGVLQ